MSWIFAFLAGGVISVVYWYSISSALAKLATQSIAVSTPSTKKVDSVQAPDEIERRRALLDKLRHEYILSHDNISSALMAGLEQPPVEWINKRLAELGETWKLEDKTAPSLPGSTIARVRHYKPNEVYEGRWGQNEKGSLLELTDKPIVLETTLTLDKKVFTLKNLGFQYVDDLGLALSRYNFVPADFASGKLTLDKWEKFGGGGFPRKVLAGHSETEPLTFGIMPGFEDIPAAGTVQPIHFDSPAMSTYFCVRVTFRDPRTAKKYVIYRVTSVTKGFSLLPEDAQPWDPRSDIKQLRFMKTIAPFITGHQDGEFNDSAERYKP